MTLTYKDRVATVSTIATTSPDLVCTIGSHQMLATITIEDHWVHTTVDGHPICAEHLLLIADTRTPQTIPESRIKKILVDRDNIAQRERVRESLRKETASSQPGWIYYVQIAELVKIGYTENLQQRIGHYPPNAKLLAVHPGTPRLEKEVHQRFAESRTRGREWFTKSTILSEHIDSVVDRFGAPEGVVKPMRHVKGNQTRENLPTVLI